MFLLYDKDSNPNYLLNSFVHVMKIQKQQFKNLNRDNTDIVFIKKNTSYEYYGKKELKRQRKTRKEIL